MTSTHIMEEISKGYLEIIANRSGYFNFQGRDYGTDLLIRKAQYSSQRNRYLTTGKAIDIQVKATHEKYITHLNDNASDVIKFALEVKAYNDLIERANETGKLIPLFLIVFIFPDDESTWVNLTLESLIIKRRAYWYNTGNLIKLSGNTDNKTISIPKDNVIELDTFDKLFAAIGK